MYQHSSTSTLDFVKKFNNTIFPGMIYLTSQVIVLFIVLKQNVYVRKSPDLGDTVIEKYRICFLSWHRWKTNKIFHYLFIFHLAYTVAQLVIYPNSSINHLILSFKMYVQSFSIFN